MRQNLRVVWVMAVFGLIEIAVAAAAQPPSAQPVERSKVCMMQDEVESRVGTPLEYEGRTYYVCCPMCATAFRKEPARYSKAQDPVSGQTVDKATAAIVAYKDKAYYFASEESRAAFARDPERYARGTVAPGCEKP